MDKSSIKEAMDKLFAEADKNKSVAILVQPSPDPDCLGAAAGFQLLLKEAYGLHGRIYHYGEVSHPQNKSMVNVLDIELCRADSFAEKDALAVVVLDTDLSNSGFKTAALSVPDVRVDHHEMTRDDPAKIEDVRSVGATCSMVWEYLDIFSIDLSKAPDVATAMILGIKTDTMDFSSPDTSELDFEAFRALISNVDRDKLATLIRYPIPKSIFESEASALRTMNKKGPYLVASVGFISPKHRDHIPIIADHFARIDDIQTVIILGIVGNNIIASVRSADSRVNVSDFCAEVFGPEHSGGKHGSGGARVPIGNIGQMIVSEEAKQVMEREIFNNISEKIFDTLGEN